MTFHVFTGVLLRVGWGVGVGGGQSREVGYGKDESGKSN